MFWFCLMVLAVISAVLVYQDFSARFIQVWLVAAFTLVNFAQYLVRHPAISLLVNLAFCAGYFLLSYLALVLYTLVKAKRQVKIMDEMLGWGDVWVALAIGCCIDPVHMVFFFTGALSLSLPVHLLLFTKKQSVPLAGFLLMAYQVYLVFVILTIL